MSRRKKKQEEVPVHILTGNGHVDLVAAYRQTTAMGVTENGTAPMVMTEILSVALVIGGIFTELLPVLTEEQVKLIVREINEQSDLN